MEKEEIKVIKQYFYENTSLTRKEYLLKIFELRKENKPFHIKRKKEFLPGLQLDMFLDEDERPMENLPPAIMYSHRICRLNPNGKRGIL